MFSKLLNLIRESINRTPNNSANACTDCKDSDTLSCSHHSSSTTDEVQQYNGTDQNCTQNMLSRFSTAHSLPVNTTTSLGRSNSISEPISIDDNDRRRRFSNFGISSVAYDDYVQKDLISSSWA